MLDRTILAKIWHERANVGREAIFAIDDARLRPVGAASQAEVAVPGMVGAKYDVGGLAIVSVNPAGGKDDFRPTAGDARLYKAASAIALSSDVGPFEEMNEAYRLGMPSWGPQWRHVDAILAAARRDLTELAYPYLVPFRTRGDAGSALGRDVVDRAFRAGFADAMKALQPALVVPVDRHSEAAVQRLASETSMPFEIVYYTRQRNAHAARASTLQTIATLTSTDAPSR